MTPRIGYNRSTVVTFGWAVADSLVMGVAALAACLVRYDFQFAAVFTKEALVFAATAIVLYFAVSLLTSALRMNHVRGSFEETADVTRTAGITGIALYVIRATADVFPSSRSLPLIAVVFGALALFAIRFVIRSYRWGRLPVREHDKRVIVLGAGTMGRQLIRSLRGDRSEGVRYIPVAALDDNPRKRRQTIDGVRVAGSRHDIHKVAERSEAEALIIAASAIEGEDLREISELAHHAGLEVLILPPVTELLHAPKGADLRRLDLEDLLGRQRIELDQASIMNSIAGKRILVTGAGGSIGSELCRQITKFGPEKLVLLDRDESAMHGAQMSLTGRALLDDGTLALCDIRDPKALERLFEAERPQVVFHAAALKHLTLLEQFPEEAWQTNVLGTLNVLEAAARVGVETFVNISTDKAAWPSSVLGYSKRLAERLTASFASERVGKYVSVRFGNVLGSRGSVITAFTTQIENGGPVTVTHPDVERFFMLIPEACQLVLQASAIGGDGEVMVLAMGKPVKIVDVARNLIEMSGKQVDIIYTGLRPGEKLSEQLFTPGEQVLESDHPLVSHVSVPHLQPHDVRMRSFEDPEEARDWMAANSGGHKDHDPSKDIAITAGEHEAPDSQPDLGNSPSTD